ncbi:MAG: hypothetical protein GQ574_01680 [Crocinitomix sp.]|nr:hypothetical protein [Crocinitomix sp.]
MKSNSLLYSLICVVVLLTACFTPKKIKRAASYSQLTPLNKSATFNALNVSFAKQDSVPMMERTMQVSKNKDWLVVVPFATWHKRDYGCAVGSVTIENQLEDNIKAAILTAADNIYGQGIDNNYDLKLTVTEARFDFNYYNKGGMAGMPPAISFTWKKEMCKSTRLFLKMDYELMQDDKSLTSGTIEREELIDTIAKYTPIPGGGNTSPERDNLNGGIHALIFEEMTIGLVAFNDNITLMARELVAIKLEKYLK